MGGKVLERFKVMIWQFVQQLFEAQHAFLRIVVSVRSDEHVVQVCGQRETLRTTKPSHSARMFQVKFYQIEKKLHSHNIEIVTTLQQKHWRNHATYHQWWVAPAIFWRRISTDCWPRWCPATCLPQDSNRLCLGPGKKANLFLSLSRSTPVFFLNGHPHLFCFVTFLTFQFYLV